MSGDSGLHTATERPASIRTVGVVGSGIMGAGLAEVIAKAGYDVIVRSRSRQAADGLLACVGVALAKQIERGKMTLEAGNEILERIAATDDLNDLASCDLVIESVVEDLTVKKSLFAALSAIVQPTALLATNTSTLPVVEMAMVTDRPDNVCGIHFFNPAPAMKLIEIVQPITASPATLATATAFARSCDKDTVLVQDRAGFIVNALLFPYLNSAVRLWEQGTASMEDIDVAMRGGCNFPIGPFALLDLVGLDTSVAILDALHAESGDPSHVAVPTLRRMVCAGRLGRKTKRGFFDYH
jgi:3-hydroxybutyryl-CoA dehydrogenase